MAKSPEFAVHSLGQRSIGKHPWRNLNALATRCRISGEYADFVPRPASFRPAISTKLQLAMDWTQTDRQMAVAYITLTHLRAGQNCNCNWVTVSHIIQPLTFIFLTRYHLACVRLSLGFLGRRLPQNLLEQSCVSATSCRLTYTHTCLTALFRDYPGEPVPER